MNEELFILLMIATGQGLFIAIFLLFQNRPNWSSNALLGALFLAFSLQLFDFGLLYSGNALAGFCRELHAWT